MTRGEIASLTFRGETLSLTGYGIATLGQAQYRYYFETAGDQTYLCLASLMGGLMYRIAYDPATQTIPEEPGTEQGSYYSYLFDEENGRYVVGEYTVTLDGYGNATLLALSESGSYETSQTGTYTAEGDVISVRWASGESYDFLLSSATVNKTTVAIYIIGDPTLEVAYTVAGSNAVIERDQFGRITFTQDDVSAKANFATGELNGVNLLVVTVYDDEGNATAAYVYRMDGTTLTQTDGRVGTYALLSGDRIYTTQTLVLDGFGGATLTQADGTQVKGKYDAVGRQRRRMDVPLRGRARVHLHADAGHDGGRHDVCGIYHLSAEVGRAVLRKRLAASSRQRLRRSNAHRLLWQSV